MNPPAVLFVVGSSVQLDTAQRVIAAMSAPAAALNIWDGSICTPEEITLPGNNAPITMSRLRRVSAAAKAWARSVDRPVLVTPQDVGLVYRRVIAVARKAGAHIAFLPDGAVSQQKVTARSMMGGLLPATDTVLRRVGFVAGRHGEMGACAPDVALSWGPAWSPVFAERGAKTVVDVGNPRSDDLASIAPPAEGRILLCSQPMNHANIGGAPSEARWYAFCEQIAASAPAGALAIRLHPREVDVFDSLPIGKATKSVLTSGTSFTDDLAWSGAVVSWASTTMMEAAGAGRTVASVAVNDAAAEIARGYMFQRDPRVLSALTNEVKDYEALQALVNKAKEQQKDLAADYLVNIGNATKKAAEVIERLAK